MASLLKSSGFLLYTPSRLKPRVLSASLPLCPRLKTLLKLLEVKAAIYFFDEHRIDHFAEFFDDWLLE
jgi:hypothetical protein